MTQGAKTSNAQVAESGGTTSRGNLVLPVILLMAIGLLAGCGLLWMSAEILDRKSEASAKTLIQSLLRSERQRISTLALDYTWWDTPSQRIFGELDPQWADSNIGSYLTEVYGVGSSFALDGQDNTVIGFIDGERVSTTAHDVIGPSLSSLIQLARNSPKLKPRPVTGYLEVGSEIQLVAVSPFTSNDESFARSASDTRPVLIVSRSLDRAFLESIAGTIGLENLGISFEMPPRGYGVVPLNDIDGQVVGYLSWQWAKPGEALLWRLAPALGSALAAMIYLLYIFFRSTDIVLERQTRLVSSLRRERELKDLKTRFISMVSHELRTPLATIRSAADLLDRYDDRLSKEDRRQ